YKEFAARAKKDQKANGKEVPERKMEIKILGTGCPKCQALEKAVREVIAEMGVTAEVKEVRDVNEIARTGVLLTPGLMINGRVKSAGKVLGKSEIKKYIEQEM
ncbi:MAG: thioredoxin family protein, partial [Desulfotomaculales bacterium]